MCVSITLLFWQKVHDSISASIYLSKVWIVTLKSERCSRLIKKALARRESIVVIHLFGFIWLHLVWVLLWPFFEKQVNVRCGIGSIFMSITSHIHNAANKDWLKNFILHSGNDFSSGYLTFDIFNNTTFFGTMRKTGILYLPMLIET